MGISIRAYNVLFGDCLLVAWDENNGEHFALIDFGNFHNDPNAVFTPVYKNIFTRTGGNLDLVVITHKHMDHLEAFYSLRADFASEFNIDTLWYAYVTPNLDNQFSLAADVINQYFPSPVWMDNSDLGWIYRNNFGVLGLTINDRMTGILGSLPCQNSYAVHRNSNVNNVLPSSINRLKIEILAPEQDSAAYFEPLTQLHSMRSQLDYYFSNSTSEPYPSNASDPFNYPNGQPAEGSPLLQLADFARLRRKMRLGGLDILAAADKTRNNTSIVLKLTYDGKKILLAGDAEEKSWDIMKQNGVDFSSHVIKVAHHGSINASPPWSFKEVFAKRRKSNAAIVSTEPTRYTGENEVPKEEVLFGWRDRLSVADRLKRTDQVTLGDFVEICF
jgi:hypothetical protein